MYGERMVKEHTYREREKELPEKYLDSTASPLNSGRATLLDRVVVFLIPLLALPVRLFTLVSSWFLPTTEG